MSLHTKYRPNTFDEVVGNEAAVKGIKNLLAKKDPNRALLLHGPSGCGKTTLARVVAVELGVRTATDDSADYHEMNASDFRGVDMIRDIRKRSMYRPASGARVWLLDECHKLTPDAQEAMLKLLEHPPAKTWFLLATTEPTKLKPTLKRRCAQFQVEALGSKEIKRLCAKVAKADGTPVPSAILNKVVKEANGSPGMALSILDTVAGLPEEEMEAAIQTAADTADKVITLCRLLAKGPSWKQVIPLLKDLEKEDPETVRRIVLEYFRKVLLSGNEGAVVVLGAFQKPFYDTGKAGLAIACYECTE